MRRRYPNEITFQLAADLRRPLCGIYRIARMLGLKKSAQFLASSESGRLTRLSQAGAPYRYGKGNVPVNKGLRRPGWSPGRMRETQFRKGNRPYDWVPIGSYRVNGDGYLDRKLRDDGLPQNRWACVHRLVWIEAHGPIPPGHAVCFRAGRRTTRLELITPDALELLSRGELMLRNSYHFNYPKEIGELIQLRGAIVRQINRRGKDL